MRINYVFMCMFFFVFFFIKGVWIEFWFLIFRFVREVSGMRFRFKVGCGVVGFCSVEF